MYCRWQVLTDHCNGNTLFVRKLVIVRYFNPEIKRPFVTLLKGINLQWTVLLSDVSQQRCPILVLLYHFRLYWVIDELICHVGPHPSELSEHLSWIWVVKCTRDHYTGSRETFNWGRNLNCPRWGFSLRNWNKMQRTIVRYSSALCKK